MFVVGHTVGGTEECPEITFDIVGSTGNIYKVVIGKEPFCDCPDGAKGNQCKHIVYGEFLAILTHVRDGVSIILIHPILTDGRTSPSPCSQSR